MNKTMNEKIFTPKDMIQVTTRVRQYSERLIKGLIEIGVKHAEDKERYLLETEQFVKRIK